MSEVDVITKQMRRLLILPFALVTIAVGPATFTNAADSLTIDYVDCPKNIDMDNQLRLIVSDQHGSAVLTRSFPRIAPAPVRRIELSLPVGFYEGVVANRDCGDELLITLLPKHDRHVVAIGRSEALLRTYRSMLSGVLPFAGAQVAVVYKNRRAAAGEPSSPDGYLQFSAMVDGDAYYAIGLPDGEATIRLYNQGHYRWLDFEGGRIDRAHGAIALIRNISIQDVNIRLQALAHEKPICVPAKGGVTICTPPT